MVCSIIDTLYIELTAGALQAGQYWYVSNEKYFLIIT